MQKNALLLPNVPKSYAIGRYGAHKHINYKKNVDCYGNCMFS